MLELRPCCELCGKDLPPAAGEGQGGIWPVMTAYNKVNGTFASQHHELLTEVLRQQWAFEGLAMSDWFGSHSTAATVAAGLDLEMPGFDTDSGAWRADAGRFEVLVGASAEDIRARAAFELTGDWREPVAGQGGVR